MNILQRYERVLRISPDTPPEYLIRYRAIWLLGLLFVAMELFNLVSMSITYGRWTYDHDAAVYTSIAVLVMVHSMRWFKAYHVYAFLYSSFVFGGIAASALPESAGINSALLPLLTIGPLLNGYISGRLATILFWILGCAFLVFLYWVSVTHPPMMANGNYVIETNRFTNAIYFLTISAGLSTMLTEQTFSAMKKMRENAERARKAEAAKSEFLAKMSHELRTPLNGVIGLTDALLIGDLPERETELVRNIRQSGSSLLQILDDLLDLSKIEAGKMRIQLAPTNIAATIDSAAMGWREAAHGKGLEFTTDISPDLVRGAQLDGLRLRQILHNLISNAIKFTDEGEVVLNAYISRQAGGAEQLIVRVKDTGCGINADAAERIFESFEQDDHASDRNYGGTGLGLPICRMLTELMGGCISLEQTSSAGSEFCVCLPLIPAELPSERRVEDVAQLELPQLKLLVAEDHEINRLVLAEYLKILGVSFDFAVDGLSCIELLKVGQYDAVLMDKNMPRLNGIEATRMIRESEQPWAKIPIIALTADAMVGEREKLMAEGMDAFLSKPLHIEELAQVLTQTLNLKPLSD